jgi:hypothetical protein
VTRRVDPKNPVKNPLTFFFTKTTSFWFFKKIEIDLGNLVTRSKSETRTLNRIRFKNYTFKYVWISALHVLQQWIEGLKIIGTMWKDKGLIVFLVSIISILSHFSPFTFLCPNVVFYSLILPLFRLPLIILKMRLKPCF